MTPTATTIPVTISDSAAARVEQFGLRQPMERIIARMKEVVPGLYRIAVTFDQYPEAPYEEQPVLITAWQATGASGDSRTQHAIWDWVLENFPFEVTSRIVPSVWLGEGDGR